MSSKSRRNFIAMSGAASFAGVLGSQASGDLERARQKTRDRYFPNIELTTHEGKKVRFYDDLIKDKIVVINFMYADCKGICPVLTANLVTVQKKLGEKIGRDIFMYSITIKPEKDTPKALHHYAMMHGVKPGWLFLTGKPDEIDMLRRKLGFSYTDPKLDKDRDNHVGMLRYGNERNMWWAMVPGEANPDWIIESILWMDPSKIEKPRNVGGRAKGGAK